MPSSNILHCVQEDIQLPNGLLSTILNELVSDIDALASCRLASHVLCSLATPFLFSSIELTERFRCGDNSIDDDREFKAIFRNRAMKLNQLLTQTTCNIATSVRTLTLRCDKVHFKGPRNGTLISEILRRLPHIRNFTLKCTS
jgi:hypothetical protein